MRGKVAKLLRGRAMKATEGAPYSHLTTWAPNKNKPNLSLRQAQGTTRWVIKQGKKRRRQIIKAGEAPWQREKRGLSPRAETFDPRVVGNRK